MSETLADDAVTLARLMDTATALLHGADARREAEAVLAAALHLSRAVLAAYPERPVRGEELARARDWLARRARGEPLAYLTGQREFWSLPFNVTPDVLVPRPETEELVTRALQLGGEAARSLVDLGTGSGCVALAIAHERPTWRVTATDISAAALAVARDNARALQLGRVELLQGDWYAPLAGRRFELIVSNPPYVASGDAALDDPALRHEPRVALTPEGDGLAALRLIVDGAPWHLRPSGWIALEHGADQARAVAEMLVARGFAHVRCAPDLAGRERVTSAYSSTATAGPP